MLSLGERIAIQMRKEGRSEGRIDGIIYVAKEMIKEKIEVEKREIKHLSNDEEKINDILTVLKCNEVTPISVEDIILEISQQKVFSIII